MRNPPLIGVVGVCASGKSTLIANLTKLGFNCRHIAQEHSYVKNMWKRITNPDILIYLEVSYKLTCERKNLTWAEGEYLEQVDRLKNALENADIIIFTDSLNSQELTELAISKIHSFTLLIPQ
ncbi:MAG: hypothetical protein NTZ74_08255 [Chloroflexi bacterium]|nr:hypothetical protein [Chloroflexota bacterium]